MAMIQLPPDFKEFLRLLNAHGVEYLLVGGYAVIYYGYGRGTGDMDLWIAASAENASRVAAVLRAFGFSAAASSAAFDTPGRIFRMGVPPFRIELLTTISGLQFSQAYSRRVRAVIDGVETNLISLDDLKANKRASGRHKDLSDLDNLD